MGEREIIVDEVTRTSGPTDACVAIFSRIKRGSSDLSEKEYWDAVREGMNKYRWRTGRHNHKRVS